MTEPNWAGGWRPAGFRPAPPPSRTVRREPAARRPSGAGQPTGNRPPSTGRKAALRALVAGLARVLLLLARLSVRLVSAALRLLMPAIGAQGALKRVGRF